jgi:hypothetical protein
VLVEVCVQTKKRSDLTVANAHSHSSLVSNTCLKGTGSIFQGISCLGISCLGISCLGISCLADVSAMHHLFLQAGAPTQSILSQASVLHAHIDTVGTLAHLTCLLLRATQPNAPDPVSDTLDLDKTGAKSGASLICGVPPISALNPQGLACTARAELCRCQMQLQP